MTFDFETLNTGGGVHPFAAERGVTDPEIITFSVAEMRLNLAPCITEAMHRIVDRGCFGYAPPDKAAFDRAVTHWMFSRHGWQVDPDWMLQSPGVISAMGAGNKVRPDAFQVADIYETSVDPLARVIRRECRNRGIDSLKVVYSQEQPRRPGKEGASGQAPEDPAETAPERRAKIPPGSTAFSPSVVGLIIAGEVVGDIVGR